MKQKLAHIVSISIIACFLGVVWGANEKKSSPVMNFLAVLDLRCGRGVEKDLSAPLTEVVIEELVRINKFTIIDRANRNKILSEMAFQQSGCVDDKCTVQVGRLLGVGRIVVGSVTKIGASYMVNLQLINVQTAAVESAKSENCAADLDSLLRTVRRVSQRLLLETPSSNPPPEIIEPPSSPSTPSRVPSRTAAPQQQKVCPNNMVYIPAGQFIMGCNTKKDSLCQPQESFVHSVYLDAFCIDKYKFPNTPGQKPLRKVNWEEAQEKCSAEGKRLATEAEWEKAARGADGRAFPWGELIDDEKKRLLGCYYPSGSYSWNVSPYGVYDMVGNLWEWTSDWYDESYYTHSPASNPKGPDTGRYKVIRGGSYVDDILHKRTSNRVQSEPSERGNYIGFRCAKSI